MSDISISFDGREPIAALRDKVDAAEDGLATGLWFANHLFQRDPIALAALALASTRRVKVSLMAVSPLTVHPVQAAMAAATLDEAFPGRVALCLGVGAPADLASVGVDARRPLRLMREAVEVARALLAGDSVRIEGEVFRVRGRQLATGPRSVPIVLAASGPKMLELAGSIADGALISAGTSVEFVARSIDHIHRGAKGRHVRAHGLVYCAVDELAGRANERLRRTLAVLLRGAHHAPNLALAGSKLDQAALDAAIRGEDWPRAEALMTDDIVHRHAASGTPGEVAARLAEYRAAGLEEIIVAGARDAVQVSSILQASRLKGGAS